MLTEFLINIGLTIIFMIFVYYDIKRENKRKELKRTFSFYLNDLPNKNGRVYDKIIMPEVINNYKKKIADGVAFVHINDDLHLQSLMTAKGIVKDIKLTDDKVDIDVQILPHSVVSDEMKDYIFNYCKIVPVGYSKDGRITNITGFSFVPKNRLDSIDQKLSSWKIND